MLFTFLTPLIVEREIELEAAARDNELKMLRFQINQHNDQLNMAKEEYERELQQLKHGHERELQMVENHIKQTLGMKEETINDLRRKLEESSIKISHLEMMIEKQRKEFLC